MARATRGARRRRSGGADLDRHVAPWPVCEAGPHRRREPATLETARTAPGRDPRSLRRGPLLVEPDDARLTALLAQPHEQLRGELALRAAEPVKISPGALVHEQAARHVDLDHRTIGSIAGREPHTDDGGDERWLDRSLAGFSHERLDQIQTVVRDPQDLSRPIIDAEDHDRIMRVRDRRELVGQIVTARAVNPASAETHGLQLEHRVLTQGDLFEQLLLGIKHDDLHRSYAGSAARAPRARPPSHRRPKLGPRATAGSPDAAPCTVPRHSPSRRSARRLH